MGCLNILQTQGHEVSGPLKGLFLMLIMMVSFLGVGAELLRLLWGLLVVLNDSTTTFLECKGVNNPQKREVCKNLLKEWKCDIVCFKKQKYLLSTLLLFGVYGVVPSLIGLFWMLCKLREGSS